MPFLADFTVELLVTIILILAGVISNWIFRRFGRTRLLRQIWALRANTKKFVPVQVIAATLTEKVNRYDRPGTGMGEAKAYAFVRESLLDAYGDNVDLRFGFSYDCAGKSNAVLDGEEPHIISLGGPKYNSIAKRLHDHFSDLPLYVDHVGVEPVAIVDRRLNMRYEPQFDDEENLLEDYGLVSRLPPDGGNSKVVVFLIEGIRTYGVAAAGQLFLPPLVKELHSLVKQAPHGYWQALVRIQVKGTSSTPILVKQSFVALDSQGRSLT